MSKFWFFVLGGVVCFAAAAVFAKLSIVYVDGSLLSGPGSSEGDVQGWAPDVTNAGASVGFAVAGGLCMIAAALSDWGRGARLPGFFPEDSERD